MKSAAGRLQHEARDTQSAGLQELPRHVTFCETSKIYTLQGRLINLVPPSSDFCSLHQKTGLLQERVWRSFQTLVHPVDSNNNTHGPTEHIRMLKLGRGIMVIMLIPG